MEVYPSVTSTQYPSPSPLPEQPNDIFTHDTTQPPPSGEKCLQCKGKAYSFTSYFHNPKIFKHPPHELLSLIEASYFLKDRLHSLLFNFINRQVDHVDITEAEFLIRNWETDVFILVKSAADYAKGSSQSNPLLDEVKNWSKELGRQALDHVKGNRGFEVPKGGLTEVLSEFRKKWESLWVAIV